jgi:Tfp pilus assembly protein PilX
VLLIVMLLLIMFTGFGILAMRHTQAELRSSGAYLDATQAADLVEGALALVATDLRSSSDYYQYQYLSAEGEATADGGVDDGNYEIPLNTDLFAGSDCGDTSHPGCIQQLSSSATDPETEGPYGAMGGLYGVDVMTYVTHKQPEVGPCPPGFSCFDDQNYGWYTFTVEATASYGSENPNEVASTMYELGRAVGKGRMTVGPIGVFGR